MVHGVLTIAALVLALVVIGFTLQRQRPGLSAAATVAALAVSASLELFDLLTLAEPGRLLVWKQWGMTAEALLPAVWLCYSLTHARRTGRGTISRLQWVFLAASFAFPAAVLALPAGSLFYSPDFATERLLFLTNAGYYFYLGILLFAVISLVNLESTYGNASLPARWQIKFDFVGAGSYLAILIFYYSQGLLYRSINMELASVRALILLLALAMMLYSVLVRGSGVRIEVSRSMAFKSMVLMAVGFYLVAVGLMGEGLRYFGDSFSRSLAVALVFFVGIGLAVALLSETFRRKARVFIHKNFYRSKYDYRIQWLQFTDRLASARGRDELLRSILAGYCEVFAMSAATLFIRSGDGVFRRAAGDGLASAGAALPEGDPHVVQMMERGWVINLREDLKGGASAADTALREAGFVFLIPLAQGGRLEGIVALGRPVNGNERYHYEDYDLMKTMACQAASAVMNLRLSEELASARELEVMGKLSTFILHDLKNLVYTLSLTVDNARDHIADPEFQEDMLGTLGNTVTRMKLLIARLRSLPEKQSLNREEADLLRLASESAALVGSDAVRVAGVAVSANVDREEIQKVIVNLVVNALEATEGKGPVTVEVGQGSGPFVRVIDAGCGIADEFRPYLFSPFRSTKKKGLGIGLYQCRQIVEAHGGRIDVESELGRETVFTVSL